MEDRKQAENQQLTMEQLEQVSGGTGVLEQLFNELDQKGLIGQMKKMPRKKAVELCPQHAGNKSMYCNAIYDII